MENWQKAGIGVAVIGAIFGIFNFFKWACHADYKQSQVTQVQWKHVTLLRERTLRSDGDWGRPPRNGGYYKEPTFNYRCYDKRNGTWCCGGHDSKTGACNLECPDYDEWCDYNYWDWPKINDQYTTGLGTEPAEFPTFGSRLDNDHRETHEKYFYVTFRRGEKDWVYTTRSDDEYKRYVVGDIWEIKIPRFGDKKPWKRSHLEQPERPQ